MTTTPSKRDDGTQAKPAMQGPDCGDNSCRFGGRGKGGQRTNGGCRCLRDLPGETCRYFERLQYLYDQQEKALSALKDELEGTKEALYTEALERDRWSAVLRHFYNDTYDYIKRNNLGDPHHNQAMKDARDLLHPPTNPIAPGSEVDGGGG